jgi:prepilin-type processing-associated H-X9-DG protein
MHWCEGPDTFPAWREPNTELCSERMKTPLAHSEHNGFTLIELLVIVLIFIVFAAMIPAPPEKQRAFTAVCMNNQRQQALGFVMFIDDHAYTFPWQLSITNGGTLEMIPSGHACPHYAVLSNYVSAATRAQILVCPTDKAKYRATNYFAPFSDENISYFLNVDSQATNHPVDTIIAGDRDLKLNGQDVGTGLLPTSRNLDIRWSGTLHPHGGVLAFADGHVRSTKIDGLNAVFARQLLATNRLVVP